jgi:hypothetical protein
MQHVQGNLLLAQAERHASQDTIIDYTRFVAAAGKDLAALDSLATKFLTTRMATHRPQFAIHQKGVIGVLYSRLQRLSTSLAHLEHCLQRKLDTLDVGVASDRTTAPNEAASTWSHAFEGIEPGHRPLIRLAPSLSAAAHRVTGLLADGTPVLAGSALFKSAGNADASASGTAPPASSEHLSTPSPAAVIEAEAPAVSASSEAELRFAHPRAKAAARPAHTHDQQQQRQELLERTDEAFDTWQLERQMREVSAMIEFISTKLVEQSEDVTFIMEAAAEARENVKAGNRELRQVNERPNTLRDMAVAALLIMATAVLFLDRWSRP